MTDTTELVVPKSIPMILLILPSILRLMNPARFSLPTIIKL